MQQRDARELPPWSSKIGAVVWLTGLSGSGKTVTASALTARLLEGGTTTIWLDGDTIREGLSADLDFSRPGRDENVRRVGEVARLLASQGAIVVVSMVSPFLEARRRVRSRMSPFPFVEVHVATPLEVCITRDPKGFYRSALFGSTPEFTGVSAPYEPPEAADVVLRTDHASTDACVEVILIELASTLQRARASPNLRP